MRYLFCLLGAIVTLTAVHAQQWSYVGTSEFTPPNIQITGLVSDLGSGLYFSFISDTGAYSVMMWDGAAWSAICTSQKMSGNRSVSDVKLCVAPGGVPYVLTVGGGHAEVRKYAAGTWALVGDTQLNTFHPYLVDMDISGDTIPYIVFTDISSRKATAMRFYNGSWNVLGGPVVLPGAINALNMKIDHHLRPLLAVADGDFQNRPTVLRYSNTSWDTIGQRGIGTNSAMPIYLDVDSDDEPHISFASSCCSHVLSHTVMGWQRDSFQVPLVGTNLGLALDGGQRILLASHDTLDAAMNVTRQIPGGWEYLGHRITPHGALSFRFVLSSSGIVYLAYVDGISNKGSVLKLEEGINAVTQVDRQLLSIGPNPVSQYLKISSCDFDKAVFRVFTADGRDVTNLCRRQVDGYIDATDLSSGMYILYINAKESSSGSFKIIKM